MSLKKLPKVTGTLSFQLTIWYAVLFSVSAILCLFVFYYRVSTITMEKTDLELLEEINEIVDVRSDAGLSEVMAELAEEFLSEDEELLFAQLVNQEGQEVGSSFSRLSKRIVIPRGVLQSLNSDQNYVYSTLSPEGLDHSIRIISGFISPAEIMHIGFSLEENEEYLEIFRDLIVLLLIPLFLLSASLGWFMARKALKGVKGVTHTAVEIASGAYDRRVKIGHNTTEINLLASTFNHMVDRLQEVVQGMREMTDNIAHDLRSPLARIRGIAEVTVTGEKSLHDYHEMALSTIEECDTLIEMINTMLEITETESGVAKLKIEQIDINSLLTDACEVFRPLAQEKNIDLSVRLPDSCYHLNGDKNKLQRLFANLIENAIKYTGSNGKIEIEMQSLDGKVEVKIKDNGVGIAEEDFVYIFNRFYRCDRSRSQSGTGLGLSLAKAIAEAFGGYIDVESTVNKGSVFTVGLFHSAV